MSIAAIMVNYNTADLVIAHLPAIRAALGKVPGSHLYITDNASPKGDAAALLDATQGMDDVTVIAAPKNGGFSYGNNRGLEAALKRTDFSHFYLLNPDAYPLPGCLETMLAFLAGHPKAGMVGSRLEGEDGLVQRSAFRFMSLASEFEGAASFGPISALLRGKTIAPVPSEVAHKADWVCGASVLMTRAVVEAVGLMDEAYFLYYEEVDYMLAAKQAGFEVWYVPDAHAVHLVGQSTDMKDGKQRAGSVPSYWYDSRRLYFRKNHSAGYAALADAVWSVGKIINGAKALLKGQGVKATQDDIAAMMAAGKRAQS